MDTITQAASLPETYEGRYEHDIEISRTPGRSLLWKMFLAMCYVLPYPRKIFNYLGLRYSLHAGRFDHHFYPVKLGMEITGRCNLRCPLCPRTAENRRPQGDMNLEDYTSVIDKLSPYLFSVRLHNYGEPMMHPRLKEMIAYTHRKGVYTNFHTNGHFLTEKNIEGLFESGLDEINIAMDGMSQSTYSVYRIGGNFERVRDGVMLLCTMRKRRKLKKPRINLQFVAMAHNEHEIPDITAFAKATGVDRLYLKSVNIYTGKDSGKRSYLPKNNIFNAYIDKQTGETGRSGRCSRTSLETLVDWDGHISICTSDHTPTRFVTGNVFRDGIDTVLFGEEYRSVREKSYRMGYQMCTTCIDNDCPV